ncbi:MAG: hypothetical protein Q4B35_06470 [Slackia sp.]|nr:hypothetical protein [Slackia sp.]
MSEQQGAEEQVATEETAANAPAEDWKSRFYDAQAEARKWEQRSKRNKADLDDALKRLDASVDASAALDAAVKRADEAEAEVSRLREQKEHADLVSAVSAATGVPADLLRGANEDELKAHAGLISRYAEGFKPGYPSDKGGSNAQQAVTVASIESIKDPVQRVVARAKNIDLYS